MDGNAVVYTHGAFKANEAKTAHGLIRGSERYNIVAFVDPVFAGRDAGELLDGKHRSIPIFPNVSALEASGLKSGYFILGIANAGGVLNREWFPEIKAAMAAGMGIVSGMHEPMQEVPELAELAKNYQVELVDIRLPKRREALHFWTGEIAKVSCPIVPVMGVDCAVGKRTTAKMLVEACRKMGKKAEMIYTGQTGWMQGWKYGFILDSTLNDFVGGELEHAIVSCWRNEQPDIIFIEGQAAMRNPSGPCGAEFLVSAKATQVILVYPPGRKHFQGWDNWQPIPELGKEIQLIEAFDVPVAGLALNTGGLKPEDARKFKLQYEQEFHLPVALPIEEGVEELAKALLT
ncbi:MAG: DUF1611 domain-containing protein [Bacteroidia bacterium]|nr:DUF1611 domain-containing protein [Bacteroidia bacterium]